MNVLRQIKKLVFGETWLLPLGLVALLFGLGRFARPQVGQAWADLGGFALLAGVVILLAVSVARGARPPGDKLTDCTDPSAAREARLNRPGRSTRGPAA